MKKLVLFIMLYAIISNCYSQKDSKTNSSGFFTIKIEELLKVKETKTLSQIASKVEYVALETNQDCIIGDNVQYFFTEKFIFVNNRDHVLKFTRDGKFISKIGNSGKGPEEIDLIKTMSVLEKKELIAIQKNSEPKLLFFNFEGQFLKTVNIPRCSEFKVLDNEDYVAYESASVGVEKYNFLLISKSLDTLSVVRNQDTWSNPKRRSIEFETSYSQPFFQFQNKPCFKSKYNDTVFYCNKNRILPRYFVDLGKYKLPIELKPEKMVLTKSTAFYDRATEFYQWTAVNASNKIFLNTANYKERDPRFFVYDIPTKNGYLLNSDTQESLGIINDWDGGINFWPIGNVNENTLFKAINVTTLQKLIENIGQKKSKYPEKQKDLIKLITKLELTDNPVLFLVTLK